MLDWEEDDRFSFEDSDRFEEDSLCSWSSEPESLCNNWRGWKKPPPAASSYFGSSSKKSDTGNTSGNDAVTAASSGETPTAHAPQNQVSTLTELCARCVASYIPFELVEHVYPPVPEPLQLRIAFWSFPDNEEDIRLYSCLANGSADEFARGEGLHRNHMVKNPLQIGFHLSANVQQGPRSAYNVAVTFDRRKISSCNCTCNSTAYWCSHVVAVCLTRIHWPHLVTLRAPVSESLSRLHRDQLQKFAQYLISELPQQILPTAQRLLDELLSSQPSAINSVCGAPDPTAGASINDQTAWYLDEKTLHDNIKKILIKFCIPAPIVFSDVNYLSTVAPPAAAEWTSLLRPLRGREPEGMWNLLSIVREMFKRNDRNAVPLLEIITNECMACDQILIWWFSTKVALLNGSTGHSGNSGKQNVNSSAHASQHACSSLCDEVVNLWRLAALNPALAPQERDMLHSQFSTWHLRILEKVRKCRASNTNSSKNTMKLDFEIFTGFKSAIEACFLDWSDYPMPGITYTHDINPIYHCPYACFKRSVDSKGVALPQINTSKAILNCEGIYPALHSHHHHHYHHHHHHHHRHYHHYHHYLPRVTQYDYVDVMNLGAVSEFQLKSNANAANENRSSISSEGFCENDDELSMKPDGRSFVDSDSQEDDGSDTSSNSSSTGSSNNSSSSCSRRSSNDNILNSATRQPPPAADVDPHYLYPNNVAPPANYENCPGGSSDSSKDAAAKQDTSQASSSSTPASPEAAAASSEKPLQEVAAAATSSSPATTSSDIACSELKPQECDRGPPLNTIRRNNDPWDILFSRAEGLHAHGHNREACILAVRLAEELLANPPDLMVDIPIIPKRKGKKQQINPIAHQISCLASATMSKCAFLCSVLAENSEHAHLAFRVGMFGLEMARPPASTKSLEVKLVNQEADLVNLLKKIPLGTDELRILRDRAEQLRAGLLKSRGDALLPVMLANFIFDALVMPNIVGRDRIKYVGMRLPTDESLGFEAAIAVLGLKANIAEAEHPLLCEGTRRQRGDLAITLLTFYKDDYWKISQIMEKLLDKEIHQLSKIPISGSYYSNNPPVRSNFSHFRRADVDGLMPPYVEVFVPNTEVVVELGCNSRPESSPSAELDQPFPTMPPTNATATQTVTQLRPLKDTACGGGGGMKYKGKRLYPSLPNQPSEAAAHFMFELAKTVLNKAGGSSSTSLFTQPSTGQSHHGPHRVLHMCAFQLGLYALGLHNCVSPNWLSRTYSSHVSWITGQAMEIGTPAISFLIDTWEGHLTPPEAASIADRASRGCDPNLVKCAAELALSCLPYSHALNPNEIQRAILQCKEQSDDMLETACHTVEDAAKGGGVYPEVLFQVARYWYELYMRITPVEVQVEYEMQQQESVLETQHGTFVTLIEPGAEMQQIPSAMQVPGGAPMLANSVPVVVTSSPSHYQHPVTTLAQLPIQPIQYSVGHYNFYPPAPPPPHGQPVGFHAHALQVHPPHAHPVQMYQLQYQPPPPAGPPPPMAPNMGPPPPAAMAPNMGPPPPPQNIQYFTTAVTIAQPVCSVRAGAIKYTMGACPPPVGVQQAPPQPPPQAMQVAPPLPPRQMLKPPHQLTQNQLRYLLNAYRVGMLAMETLARKVHDDRPQAKYARNPPYGEDVKWLLRMSKHLGSQYLHHFCVCAVNSIVSPFVLYDIALEAAQYLSRGNPALVMQHLRTALLPLVQKCQQMYIQCMHQKLYHLTPQDYEEFIGIVCAAKAAFHVTPDGNVQFKEWLQSIRRSKSCKKDLWAQINAALQASNK